MKTRTLALGTVTIAAMVGGLTAAPADAAPARPAISVHVASKHHVVAPGTTRPGLVRVRNTGSHDVFLLKKKHASESVLVRELNRSEHAGGPGKLVDDFTLLDALDGHTDGYATLTRGTYYLVDADASKYAASMIHTLTVKGKPQNAARPAATQRLAISRSNALGVGGTLPRSGYLHLTNADARLNELLVFRIGSAVSQDTINAFLAAPDVEHLDRLQVSYTPVIETVVAGGHSIYTGYHGAPGRYIALALAFTSHTRNPKLVKGEAAELAIG